VRQLTPGLTDLLGKGGSYIGFTTDPLNDLKRKSCIEGIREGITETGADPDRLSHIQIYGANEIAAWVQLHPGVAIWLAEKSHDHSLSGYRTIQWWGTRDDFVSNPYAPDHEARFATGAKRQRDESGATDLIPADTAWQRILDHIAHPGRLVRVAGASGLGKSRFVYEALRETESQLSKIIVSSAVFADYRTVPLTLLATAQSLADTGRHALLVVDECPRDIALELGKIVTAEGSGLRVISIDTDTAPLEETAVMHMALYPSTEGALIDQIIRQRNPGISSDVVERLRDICGGFPRFAVLAAGNVQDSASPFETASDVVDRILSGAGLRSDRELRALQCLCLFETLAIEGDGSFSPLDLVSDMLARMPGDEMYEHLAKARDRELVATKRGHFSAQPIPIALDLSRRPMAILRPSLLQKFIAAAPDDLVLALLNRWRFLDTMPVIREAATTLLRTVLNDRAAVLSPRGSAMLDALVHVVPDRVADRLRYDVLGLTSEELATDPTTRRNLVEALSKLVFRSQSFPVAARLLLRLGAAETENWANNAEAIFKQLFQLQLSGTEVAPRERFAILDEGLATEDPAIRSLCLDALSSVFSRDFTRFGDTERIGSGPPLKDWHPTTWGDVNDFHREGLRRLLTLRSAGGDEAKRCEAIIATATRLMLGSGIYQDWADCLLAIKAEKGEWPEAVEAVGDWLYFDREDKADEHALYVRGLYDALFPTDPISRAIVFTQFYRSHIRDPDLTYSEDDRDFDYSERRSREVATQIARNPDLSRLAVERMTRLDLKAVSGFAAQLAEDADNREELFEAALVIVDETLTGMPMLRGLLQGLDVASPALANACLARAKVLLDKRVARVDLYTAVQMDRDRLDEVIADVRSGSIEPAHSVLLSYGRGLDELSEADVIRLVEALAERGSDGIWAGLEVALMYHHGSTVSADQARTVAILLADPAIVDRSHDRQRDDHIYMSLLNAVRSVIGIDAELAEGLAAQVIRLAKTDDHSLFTHLDGAMRSVIVILRDDSPEILWAQIGRFYETATNIELNRMRRLIGMDSDRYGSTAQSEAGVLFGLPEDIILSWADAGDDRPPVLLDFYPMLEKGVDPPFWHPALERLVARYASSPQFRAALGARLRPRSWSGSIIPLLELYLAPLQSWFEHENAALASWAREEYGAVVRRIEIEAEYETGFQ
jgi:hypothetical protein